VSLLENWYDASLYFLDQADYMRKLDMRTVQTIAILLGLYKNMGDFSLHSTHLACGIRIAQHLHLDNDSLNTASSLIDNEVRRRVWWTLMICEWLQRPIGPFFVRESEFDVALPLHMDDEELVWQSSGAPIQAPIADRPRAVQYHLVLIDVAKLWHRFRLALPKIRQDPEKLESLVLQNDEALADIIDNLPLHLQDDACIFDSITGPLWIPWQRNSLSMSLLYYRMAINRILQDQWVQFPNSFARTQAICIGSARAIISVVDRYSATSARNRPWAIASTLFSAAVTLAVEARFSDGETAASYVADVRRCVAFLSTIRDRNVVAARAVEVLNSCLTTTDQPISFQPT